MSSNLNINPITTITGLLDFQGNDYVQFYGNPSDVDSVGTVYKWNMWIDSSAIEGTTAMMFSGSTRNFWVRFRDTDDSRMLIDAKTAYSPVYDLSPYKEQIIEVEVKMTNAAFPASPVDYVKVNGTTLSEVTAYGSTGLSGNAIIGDHVNGGAGLDNGTVWDVRMYYPDTSLVHQWDGRPDGNTNSAWVDSVGSLDGSVYGSPGIRSVSGYGGGGSVSSMSNKLEINQSVEYGTLNWDGSVYVAYTPKYGIDPSNNKTIKFKMILDVSEGFLHNGVFTFRNEFTSSDSFEAELDGSVFRADTGTPGVHYYLADFPIGEIFDIEITKSYQSIDSLKVNNQTLTQHVGGSTSSSNVTAIGFCGTNEFQLEDAAIWDFEIYDGVTLLHKMLGYPAGNTSTPWNDIVGGNTATLTTVGGGYEPTIRNIEGTEGNIFDLSNKLILQGTYIEPTWLLFSTEASSGVSYRLDPEIQTTAGAVSWDWGDGTTTEESNLPVKEYADGTSKTVKMYQGSVASKSNVTFLNMYSDQLVGSMDISELKDITDFNVYNNRLTSITTPDTSAIVTSWWAQTNNLAGELDLSGYHNIEGDLRIYNNPDITSVLLPTTKGIFTIVNLNTLGVSTIDFSPLENLSGAIYAGYNDNLTSIQFPDSSQNISTIQFNENASFTSVLDVSGLTGLGGLYAPYTYMTGILFPETTNDITSISVYQSDLTGTLDFSPLGDKFGGIIRIDNNPNLTGIINPVSSRPISYYNAYSSGLTGTLDVSGLTGLGGQFNNNTNELTSILFPASSEVFTTFRVDVNNLTGTLDVSGLTGLGGIAWFQTNPSLNEILLPTSSEIFTAFRVDGCDLTGILDLTSLSNLGGDIRFGGNENITDIQFPDSSQAISYISGTGCTSIGTLDISSLTGLGGPYYATINMQNCDILTTILFPNTDNRVSQLYLANCDLTGTLDITPLTNFGSYSTGGTISTGNNSNLTGILIPDTSSNVFNIAMSGCDLTGNLDLSGIYYLGIGSNSSNSYGSITLGANSKLSSITFPAVFQGPFTALSANDCSLNQPTVDNIFSLLNAQFSLIDPSKGLAVNLGGGTNMPPTDGSSNADILNLESIFSSAGQTLTITIN